MLMSPDSLGNNKNDLRTQNLPQKERIVNSAYHDIYWWLSYSLEAKGGHAGQQKDFLSLKLDI